MQQMLVTVSITILQQVKTYQDNNVNIPDASFTFASEQYPSVDPFFRQEIDLTKVTIPAVQNQQVSIV